MIRINLLPEGAKRAGAWEAGGAEGLSFSPVLVVGGSALVCFALVGGLAWFWSARSSRFEREVKKEQTEQARLAVIGKENQVYARQLKELEQRVQTIRALEQTRTAPVQFMTALGETVDRTRDVYLVSVGPDGDRLLVKGQAGSVASIADFIAALKRSGEFAQVELGQYYQDDQAERLVFKFDLHCVYRSAGEVAGEPQAAEHNAARAKS